jgi:hypothetical protein
MGYKTQWCGVLCGERVTRQTPYGNQSFVRVRLNIVEGEKQQVLPIVSVRVVGLVIWHAMRMRPVILLLSIIFLQIVS